MQFKFELNSENKKIEMSVKDIEFIGKLGLIGSTELNVLQQITEKAPTLLSQYGATFAKTCVDKINA